MVIRGRAFDRLVNFTDAVVAVAITLLGLPLVDIRARGDEQTVWQVIADHWPELLAFAYTFLVVAAVWKVHNRVINRMRGYDSTIFRLNVLWLIGIVLLPWPSALYGEGIREDATEIAVSDGLGSAGLFYWGVLAYISLIAALIAEHVRRRPELLDPDNTDPGHHPLRGFAFALAFAALGVISVGEPTLSSWLALLLIPLALAFASAERARPSMG